MVYIHTSTMENNGLQLWYDMEMEYGNGLIWNMEKQLWKIARI